MRLELEIIEDELVEGFNAMEQTLIKLDEVNKYIKRIRNESKKNYASDYLNYLKGECDEPEVPSGLSFLDAQNVRVNLQGMTEGLVLEAPIQAKGWTKGSVEKFGKTIGKSPKEHGFFDACVSRMSGKEDFDGDKAKRFCASVKDASYGSAYWRGKDKSKKEIAKDVKAKPFKKQMKESINEAMKIKCSRCKKVIVGKDEYDAEMKFNMHKCKGMRDLYDMPMDLLELVVKGKMTEIQAWKEADKRKGK
jgi:hypothetical protein